MLQTYGQSIRHGSKSVLHSLPRLLTLYFDFSSEQARRSGISILYAALVSTVCLLKVASRQAAVLRLQQLAGVQAIHPESQAQM